MLALKIRLFWLQTYGYIVDGGIVGLPPFRDARTKNESRVLCFVQTQRKGRSK